MLLVLAALFLSPEIPVAPDVLRNAPGMQSRPSIASDGTELFAAWESNKTYFANSGDVVGSRIGATGEVLDRDGGIPLQPMWVSDMEPVVVWNGTTYAVAIEDGPAPWPYGVKVVEVQRDGHVISERWLVSPRDVTSMDFTWNGTLYLLVWRESSGSVRAQRFNRAFEPLGAEQLLGEDGVEVAVASNGIGFLAAWTTPSGTFVNNLTTTTRIGDAAPWIDAASDGIGYAVFANDVVALDEHGVVTRRTTMPQGTEYAIAWNGTHWIAAWSTSERIYFAELDAMLGFTRAPQRLVDQESRQHFPAIAGTIVLWSDGPQYREDIRSAFLGHPTAMSLVSTGLADQMPMDAAWAGSTLGVLWSEGDGISASLRLGLFAMDGTRLSGEGEAFAPALEARLAANGDIFAIVAQRDEHIEVDLPSGTVVLEEGTMPWIAGDGRDWLVAWRANTTTVHARIVHADGTLGPLRELPAMLAGVDTQLPAGVVWDGSNYVVLTFEHAGFVYAIVSTPMSASGEAGTPSIVNQGSAYRTAVNTRIATNGRDVLYVWSTVTSITEGAAYARIGLNGDDHRVAAGVIEDVAFAHGEPLYLVSTRNGRYLWRGGAFTAITAPVVLADSGPRGAVLTQRTIDRIPGFPDLSVNRVFLRFVLEEKRRTMRH